MTTDNRKYRVLIALLTTLALALCALPALAQSVGADDLFDYMVLNDPNVDIKILGEDEFAVIVQKSKPNQSQKENVQNAAVTIETSGADGRCMKKTVTVNTGTTTKDAGLAVFKIEQFRTKEQCDETKYFYGKITVEKAGYPTFVADEVRLIGGDKTHVFLDQNEADPYIRTITFNSQDIMFTKKEVFVTPKNDGNQYINVSVAPKGQSGECKCELFESDTDHPDKLIASATAAVSAGNYNFSFKDTWLSKLTPGKNLIVKASVGGKEVTVKSALVIMKAVIDEPQTNKEGSSPKICGFSMENGELKFQIPDKVAVIGGYKVAIAVPNMPITFYYDTSGKMLLGVSFTFSKEPFNEDPEKQGWKRIPMDKLSDWMDESMNKFKKDANKILNNVTPLKGKIGTTPFMNDFKITFTIGAMFKGENITSKTKNMTVDAYAFAKLGATFSTRKYIFAGPVPFYFGATIKGELSLNVGLNLELDRADPIQSFAMKNPNDKPAPRIAKGAKIDIAANVGVSVTAGVGLQGIVCVYVEGGVALMPSISILKSEPPNPKYPHYVIKLNFSLRAGVKILWKTWEMTPISYDLILIDNWYTPQNALPKWVPISGPWKAATPALNDPNAKADSEGMSYDLTDAEIAAISLGTAIAPTQSTAIGTFTYNLTDANGDGDNEETWVYDTVGGGVYDVAPIDLSGSAKLPTAGVTLDDSPYKNDAVPYEWDEVITTGEDGLGIVVPDKVVTLLQDTYYDPHFTSVTIGDYRFLFFIGVANVNGVNQTTVMYVVVDNDGNLVGNKVYPLLHKDALDPNNKNRHYVTDFALGAYYQSNEKIFHIEMAAVYAKDSNPYTSHMGLFNLALDVEVGKTEFKLNYRDFKDISVDTTFNYYKAASPSVYVSQLEGRKYAYDTCYVVCIAWVMQDNFKYEDGDTQCVPFITRKHIETADHKEYVTWGSRKDSVVNPGEPITEMFLMHDFFDDENDEQKWNILVNYNKDRTLKTTNNMQAALYSVRDSMWNISKSPEVTLPGGRDFVMVSHIMFVYTREDNNTLRWVSTVAKQHLQGHDLGITVPEFSTKIFVTHPKHSKGDVYDYTYDLYYYWVDTRTYRKGQDDFPSYQGYNRLMCRIVSLHESLENEIKGVYYVSPDFIACGLDKRIDDITVYPGGKGAMFDLFYTHMPDLTKGSATVSFARVANVAAAETKTITPSDPCLARGERARMYFEIENSGNNFLTAAKLKFTMKYKLNGANLSAEVDKEINLLDCDRIVATAHEFDFDKLAEGEYYSLDEVMTLSEALSDPLTADYFDEGLTLDTVYNNANPSAGKKLKVYAPGELHLYFTDIDIPKDAQKEINISVKVTGVTVRKFKPDGSYTDVELNGTGWKDELGAAATAHTGTYFAETTGASCATGYDDIAIEGKLFMDGMGEEYLSLSVRNETTSISDVVLEIYGDDTLLLKKTFANVTAGALSDTAKTAGGEFERLAGPNDLGLNTAGTGESGFVNLTLPIKSLTQGKAFYKLRAVAEPASDVTSLEALGGDEVSFVLRGDDILRFSLDLESQLVDKGGNIDLTVNVMGGVPPYTFYWQKYNEISRQWDDIALPQQKASLMDLLMPKACAADIARASTYGIRGFSAANEGDYRCAVADATGVEIISKTATLKLSAPVTGDGFPVWQIALIALMSLIGAAACVVAYRRRGRA